MSYLRYSCQLILPEALHKMIHAAEEAITALEEREKLMVLQEENEASSEIKMESR